MQVLICPNRETSDYVHALNEGMMLVYSQIYDIVINECMDSDVQEQENFYWCQVMLVDEDLAKQFKSVLDWYRFQYEDIAPNSYSWQKNRIGIEVRCYAHELHHLFKRPGTEVIYSPR